MGSLRDIRVNRFGLVILVAISLAATIVILTTGGPPRDDAQLAAEAALKNPHKVVDEVVASVPTVQSSHLGSGGGGSSPAVSGSVGSGARRSTVSSGGSAGAASSGSGSGSGTGGSSPSGGGSTGGGETVQTSTQSTTTTTAADAGLPKVGHVFLITLSTPSYRAAFGAGSKAPYLRTLARRGTVLTGYHALARNGLADVLAMVSGQPPNPDTLGGCVTYAPYSTTAVVKASGIVVGNGCVYPDAALSLADQVNSAGQTWGAYIQDMGSNNCSVPGTGDPLDTPLDGTQEGYDLAHNPFAFFGSLLDEGGCSEYDQDLSNLPAALAKAASTPSFTYVGGDACVDATPTLAPATTSTSGTGTDTTTTATGTETTATDATTMTTATATATTPARLIPPAAYGCPAGETSGIAGENAFLKTWVPKILASVAYRKNGVLVIAFTGAGGAAHAKTGALIVSRWTPRGKKIATAYTAYSLLHSVEDMLDLATLARSAGAPAFAKLVLR
jgi:hypothetical protein